MVISHASLVEGDVFNIGGAKDVLRKVLISEKEGWNDYVMRLFEVGEGGCSPRHSHDWPHIIFVVNGKGTIHMDGKDNEVKNGSYAFIPGGMEHQLLNTGNDIFSFICIVPPEGN